MRRQIRKQTIKDMARKGRVAFKGKPYRRRSSEYACGPCSETKGYRVYHHQNSQMGRMHFGYNHSNAHIFPTKQESEGTKRQRRDSLDTPGRGPR